MVEMMDVQLAFCGQIQLVSGMLMHSTVNTLYYLASQ